MKTKTYNPKLNPHISDICDENKVTTKKRENIVSKGKIIFEFYNSGLGNSYWHYVRYRLYRGVIYRYYSQDNCMYSDFIENNKSSYMAEIKEIINKYNDYRYCLNSPTLACFKDFDIIDFKK